MAEAKSVVEKVKEAINKLPFNNLVGKIPALAKFSGYANYAACLLAVILVVAVAKPSSSGGSGSTFGSTVKVTSQDIIEKVSKLKKESTIQVQGFIDCETLRWAVESSPFLIDLDLSKTQGLETIESDTFRNCKQLSGITLPVNVKKIKDGGFRACSNLTAIRFTGTLSQWCNINKDDWYWWIDEEQVVDFYVDGKQLKGSIEIPKGTTNINGFAFANCTEITSVKFPEDIKIDSFAFLGCMGLKSITIPSGAKIEERAFKNSGITKVSIASDAKKVHPTAFNGCADIALTITKGNSSAMSFTANCREFKSIVIENGITEIGENAFSACYATEIKIPDTVTTIGDNAFVETRIQAITLPKKLTNIGKNAFNSSKIQSIVIPEGVTVIEESTFRDCKELESVTLPKTLNEIKWYSFYSCKKLASIKIPDGITEIKRGTFEYCDALSSVEFGKGLTLIEEDAFEWKNKTSVKFAEAGEWGQLAYSYIQPTRFIITDDPAVNAQKLKEYNRSYGLKKL